MNNKFFDIGFYKVDEKVFFNEGLFSKYFFSIHDVIYCNNSFYIYEDNYWNLKTDLEIKKICKDCFDEIEIGVWKLIYENKYFPTIKTDAPQVQEKLLNQYPYKMNFQNGVYNFKIASFEEHCKENYFTYILDYSLFSDINPTPCFDLLIETLSNNNKELDNFLRMLTAYIVSSVKTEQKFYMLKSRGNSGKSTYINLITKILTQNFVSSIPLNKLEDRFTLSEAVGKKLIVAAENESNEKMKIKTETLKQLSGDDHMRIEKKYKDAYTDKLNVELLFATNSDNLVFEDLSEGLKRRITVVETEGVVKQKIVDFDKKLEEEIPYIMTKLIEYFKDIVGNNFKLPLCDSVVNSTNKVINQSINEGVKVAVGEDFLNFFEDNLEYDKDSRVTKHEVYKKYKENGGKETTTKFWIRFDRWINHKKYSITKTNPPHREVIGIKFIDNKIENNVLENLF